MLFLYILKIKDSSMLTCKVTLQTQLTMYEIDDLLFFSITTVDLL